LPADDPSFEQIVRDHQAMVFRTLIRLTGTREHIDDLAQDVFLRLYRALPAFRGEALLSTYLYRIDRPLVSFSEEESAWEDRLPHPGLDAEQQFSEREFRYSVEQQLHQLSPMERTILVLYHQEERSYEQIALSLKLPIGTVRTHLHRGRKKLREGIQRQQETERGTAWQKTR
jgi:RNA polymerase sigma-70 factor (ECF subfamily)